MMPGLASRNKGTLRTAILSVKNKLYNILYKSRLYLIKPWMYETMLSDNETRERKTEIPWKTAEMTK